MQQVEHLGLQQIHMVKSIAADASCTSPGKLATAQLELQGRLAVGSCQSQPCLGGLEFMHCQLCNLTQMLKSNLATHFVIWVLCYVMLNHTHFRFIGQSMMKRVEVHSFLGT